MRGPILGLDFGTRRIGLAISDADAAIAFPIGVLEVGAAAETLVRLAELARERGVTAIVVGLPLHMDGAEGDMAAAARSFARRLAEATGLPVDLLDERWTSLEAERALREAPPRRRRGRRHDKGEVDTLAATLVLRTHLERARAAAARAGAR